MVRISNPCILHRNCILIIHHRLIIELLIIELIIVELLHPLAKIPH